MKPSTWIWMDGEWRLWNDATVHVSVHGLHYGSSVFEGVRAYETDAGPAYFRLQDHLRRLLDSARILRMDLGYSLEELEAASLELADRNGHRSCYLRPIAFRGGGGLGVDGRKLPMHVVLLSFEWGAYLGEEALERGIDVAVSSWRRPASGTLAPMAKIGGQYVNSQLVVAQAQIDGYGEGIVLDESGLVSEGSGENLFAVKNGVLLTPPVASSILSGITRDSVLTLARDAGLEVREASMPRDVLYLADELFFTGTAAEITPIRSVDRIEVGDGRRGPVTELLQKRLFDLLAGRGEDRHGWLTPVRPAAPQKVCA